MLPCLSFFSSATKSSKDTIPEISALISLVAFSVKRDSFDDGLNSASLKSFSIFMPSSKNTVAPAGIRIISDFLPDLISISASTIDTLTTSP